MKNKEKFAKEILEIACSGDVLAVSKVTGKPISCKNTRCEDCNRCNDFPICEEKRLREWAESEYVEPMRISKKDRAFLDYLGGGLKYIARSQSGNLIACQKIIEKSKDGWVFDYGIKSLTRLNIDFPMIKWSDAEPWKIEDLKNLEVCDEY